jgi:AraC family transcriptional regulator of adaptative response / DNA-3-methyladenine glycosylase II
LLLAYREPYDWAAMATALGVAAGPWRRALEGGGEVTVEPAPGRDALRVTVAASRLAELPSVIARVRRVFDLAVDPTAIGAALARDPLLAPLVAERPGLRAPGAWDTTEPADPDRFDPGDSSLARAIRRLTGEGLAPAALLGHAEAWRPWRAYAAQHLITAAAQLPEDLACAA